MASIILLAVCFLIGIVIKKTGRFPATTPVTLNAFVIYISLPALVILHIHSLKFDISLALTALMAWLVFGFAAVVFGYFGQKLKVDKKTIGGLIIVAGLGNTSFVGLPMIEGYFGKQYLGVGIIADQLGSFMVLSTLGLFVASYYSGGSTSFRQMSRKILMFPPFQGIVVAVLLRPFVFPEWGVTVLEKIGGTLTPLALVSVGFQLQFGSIKTSLKALISGLSYKLFFAPVIIYLLYVIILTNRDPIIQVTIFEAAMPTGLAAGIVAIDHDLNPQLIGMMVGLGIPISFFTLYFWHSFLASI